MRLIDGNKIVMSLADWWYSSFRQEETEESKAIKKVMEQVEKMVMGMPEIVRCKDCEHCEVSENTGVSHCFKFDFMNELDDFCSYGERKEKVQLSPETSTNKVDTSTNTPTNTPTDLISRQAAIEAMAPFDTNHELRDTLEGLPSVEPPKKVEPKTDLVNRSDVLELVKSGALISVEKYENYKKMCKAINGLPSCHTCRECEPERPKGEWIEVEGYNGDIHYQCNQCGDEFILIDGTPEDNNYLYCPNCGAYMRGDKE